MTQQETKDYTASITLSIFAELYGHLSDSDIGCDVSDQSVTITVYNDDIDELIELLWMENMTCEVFTKHNQTTTFTVNQ